MSLNSRAIPKAEKDEMVWNYVYLVDCLNE